MCFTDDMIIDDINWYKVVLMFMTMLIENDVVIEDDIDNNWYETMLVFMIILIWQGDLDACCLDFLSESVAWTRLGYFLMSGTTLNLRVDVRFMHHTEHDWLELWTDDDYLLIVCWTNGCLCMVIIFVNVFLLIMVILFLC